MPHSSIDREKTVKLKLRDCFVYKSLASCTTPIAIPVKQQPSHQPPLFMFKSLPPEMGAQKERTDTRLEVSGIHQIEKSF